MMVKTKGTIETLNNLKAHLDTHKKVFYTRFGDGEIVCMMGNGKWNHTANASLAEELKESFLIDHPQFLTALAVNYPFEKGMTNGLFAPFDSNTEMLNFLTKNNLFVKNEYESFIMFHYLSVFKSKLIYSFFEDYIRPKKKLFIGSTKKEIAEKLYGKIDYYVQVPGKNVYNNIEDWWPAVEQYAAKVDLVIPSAGVASNVISKRLWNMDLNIHLLDIGSIIDAVDNLNSRGWIRLKGYKIQNILPREQRNKNLNFYRKAFSSEMKYIFRRHIKYARLARKQSK